MDFSAYEYPIMLAFSMDGLVKYAAWIGGGVLAIFLIYAIAKDGIAYAKGGGSIFPIIGKVLFLLLCLGLIFIVTKYTSIGDKAKEIAGKGIEIIGQQAETIANGGA